MGRHGADDACAQDEYVHVVVLDTLMGGVVVVAEARADAFKFIRRD